MQKAVFWNPKDGLLQVAGYQRVPRLGLSPEPRLGVELGRAAPQLELQDVVRAYGADGLAGTYLLTLQ